MHSIAQTENSQKILPIEKFAIAKAERYIGQKATLPVSALYAWNGFQLLAWNKDLLHNIII